MRNETAEIVFPQGFIKTDLMYVSGSVLQHRQEAWQAEVGHLVHLGVHQDLKWPVGLNKLKVQQCTKKPHSSVSLNQIVFKLIKIEPDKSKDDIIALYIVYKQLFLFTVFLTFEITFL